MNRSELTETAHGHRIMVSYTVRDETKRKWSERTDPIRERYEPIREHYSTNLYGSGTNRNRTDSNYSRSNEMKMERLRASARLSSAGPFASTTAPHPSLYLAPSSD